MQDLDKKIVSLKLAVRKAINGSGLPLSVIELTLDSLRAEVSRVKTDTMMIDLLKEEETNKKEEKEV